VSVCGVISNEGWLMVFIIAPIETISADENAELMVKVDKVLVPIKTIIGLFVGTKCPSYAEKPKVFFCLDFDAGRKTDGPTVCQIIAHLKK
jgi:hypothetical protein